MTSFSDKENRSERLRSSQNLKIVGLQVSQVAAPILSFLCLSSLISLNDFGSYLQLNALVGTASTVAFGAFEVLFLRLTSSQDVISLMQTVEVRRYFWLATVAFLIVVGSWLYFVTNAGFWSSILVSFVSLVVGVQILCRSLLTFSKRYLEVVFLVVSPSLGFCGYCLMTSKELSESGAFLVWLIFNVVSLSVWGLFKSRAITLDTIRALCFSGNENRTSKQFDPPFTLMQINSFQLAATGWAIPSIAAFKFQGELDAVVSGITYLNAALATVLLSLAVREQQFGRAVSGTESSRIIKKLRDINWILILGGLFVSAVASWHLAGRSTVVTSLLVTTPLSYVLIKTSELSLLKIFLLRDGEVMVVRRQMVVGAVGVIVAMVVGVVLNPTIGVFLGAGVVSWVIRSLRILHENSK